MQTNHHRNNVGQKKQKKKQIKMIYEFCGFLCPPHHPVFCTRYKSQFGSHFTSTCCCTFVTRAHTFKPVAATLVNSRPLSETQKSPTGSSGCFLCLAFIQTLLLSLYLGDLPGRASPSSVLHSLNNRFHTNCHHLSFGFSTCTVFETEIENMQHGEMEGI